jgi:hypothetical protein
MSDTTFDYDVEFGRVKKLLRRLFPDKAEPETIAYWHRWWNLNGIYISIETKARTPRRMKIYVFGDFEEPKPPAWAESRKTTEGRTARIVPKSLENKKHHLLSVTTRARMDEALDFIEAIFDSKAVGPLMLGPEEAESSYEPGNKDSREIVIQQIKARRGQRDFRRTLMQRYGDKCLISGCRVRDVLEAAHIMPYRGEPDNHPENGLLLRADLHTLFDVDLIGIDPDTLKVVVHPSLLASEYASYVDKPIASEASPPSPSALRIRFSDFRRRFLQADRNVSDSPV